MEKQFRTYGVSFGNGNDGVSRMFPSFYVVTAEPWRLARIAMLSDFKPGLSQTWADSNLEIDGDEDFGISGMIFNPPCEDSEDGEYPDLADGVEYEDAEDGRNWSDHNGAWMLCEVAPLAADADPRDGTPFYVSIADAFSEDLLRAFPPMDGEDLDSVVLPSDTRNADRIDGMDRDNIGESAD